MRRRLHSRPAIVRSGVSPSRLQTAIGSIAFIQPSRIIMKSKSRKDCSRCNRKGETFWCFSNRYIFDIDMARDMISDGRPPIELEPDDVEYSIDHCEINKKHLDHVDPSIPGIVGHVFVPADNGELVHCHRLIVRMVVVRCVVSCRGFGLWG